MKIISLEYSLLEYSLLEYTLLEPTVSARERPQTYTIECAATGTGKLDLYHPIKIR